MLIYFSGNQQLSILQRNWEPNQIKNQWAQIANNDPRIQEPILPDFKKNVGSYT